MHRIKTVAIMVVGDYLQTSGLKPIIGQELKLKLDDNYKENYVRVLHYLIEYFFDNTSLLKAQQTIAYHSWLLKFVPAHDGVWNVYEAQCNGDGFVEGAAYAVNVINEQESICELQKSMPLFPTFSQMVAISDGVLDGLPVDAVRYNSPEHMTGWWITTDLFDGNIQSLKIMHFYHVAFSRPDLIKYLALPFGYRFVSGDAPEIWFDKNIVD